MIANAMGKENVEEGKDYVFLDFHSTRPGHDSRYAMSGKKLADLGWVAPVKFEDSLKKTVLWTQQHPQWVK